jgi:cyanophycinase
MQIKSSLFLLLFLLVVLPVISFGQQKIPKGNLFIIGGGNRSDELMNTMLATAKLGTNDYMVVLPMSGAEPDTSYWYFANQMQRLCKNTIANLNFTRESANNTQWLDSLAHAKLIFITGGDQTRFMNIVLHTPIYTAIHNAYQAGATIAGTSAGAAVMSKKMITGNHLLGDTSYSATFDVLIDKNIEIAEGLGLLDSVIVDQHFIVRSRYNRLLSALAAFPTYNFIGIDEATAIIVHQKKITVTGESQVIRFVQPKNLKVLANGIIKFNDVQFSIYSSGDSFELP